MLVSGVAALLLVAGVTDVPGLPVGPLETAVLLLVCLWGVSLSDLVRD